MNSSNTAPAGLALLAIALLGVNLRPALAAIGPMLDTIQAATGLGNTGASLLTTLPVLAMGLGALWSIRLQRAIGDRIGIALGIVVLALACAMRAVFASTSGLIVTAVLAGTGIAFMQALLPGFIKRRFPGTSSAAIGIFTTAITIGGAGAAATTPWLAEAFGWSAALATSAIPAALALLVWLLVTRDGGKPASRPPPGSAARQSYRWWRHDRALTLLLFFGLQAGAYMLVLAWLPPYYTALGWSAADSGLLLGGVNLMQIVSGIAVSAFAHRFHDRRIPLSAVLLLLLGGQVCLVMAPLSLAIPACCLVGLGLGGIFPLALIVTMDHSHEPQQAAELLAFVQGGGYLLASVMPLAAGYLRDVLADLVYAWLLLGGATLAQIIIAMRFSPKSCVLHSD